MSIDPAEKSDIQRLEAILHDILDRLAALEAGQVLSQEWYTLRQAARLKRGIEVRRSSKTGQVQTFDSFFNTLKTRDYLQPGGGNPDGHQGGVPVWHRNTIMAWLRLTDEQLETLRKAS